LSPQHAKVLTPQANANPALICSNAPAGGVDCPWVLFPQQAIVPSLLNPQEKSFPVATWIKVPLAGSVAGLPQHAKVPSVLKAQAL
jgi:hypothetical protein